MNKSLAIITLDQFIFCREINFPITFAIKLTTFFTVCETLEEAEQELAD